MKPFRSTLHTQENSYSISHLLGTVTEQWRCNYCWQLPAAQWLHCVITVLSAVNNGDYTVTVQSLCLVGYWWNRSFPVYDLQDRLMLQTTATCKKKNYQKNTVLKESKNIREKKVQFTVAVMILCQVQPSVYLLVFD